VQLHRQHFDNLVQLFEQPLDVNVRARLRQQPIRNLQGDRLFPKAPLALKAPKQSCTSCLTLLASTDCVRIIGLRILGLNILSLKVVPKQLCSIRRTRLNSDTQSILDGGIQIVGGRTPNLHPLTSGILGMRGATIKVSYPKPGSKFKGILLLDDVDVAKEGVWSILLATIEEHTPNQRDKWNTDIYTDGTKTLAKVAQEVVDLFNTQNKNNLGVTATFGTYTPKGGSSTPAIIFTADDYNAWTIIPSNNLLSCTVVTAATAFAPEDISLGYKPFLDNAYVLDKIRQNAAEEGFENIGGNLSELYPGYNNPALFTQYALIHIRSYYPKTGGATVDEALWQITDLYIPYEDEAVPDDGKNAALKSILKVLNKAKVQDTFQSVMLSGDYWGTDGRHINKAFDMISSTYVNKVKSYAIHICGAKQKYIEEGVIVPVVIDKELNLLSAFEQCLYVSDSFTIETLFKLYRSINELIKYVHLGDVPIYTFSQANYMK
ncbi:MAG: hypothetical protein EZS28_043238, partial [Streblomastix strix]